MLALSSLIAVSVLLLLVFQGQSLLMDKCLVPSLPRDDRTASLLWDLWLDIDLGDCPGATTTPRFSWLTEDGRLHMSTDSCTDPRYSYSFSPPSPSPSTSTSSASSSSSSSQQQPSSSSPSSSSSMLGIAGGERSYLTSPQPLFIEHDFVRTACTFPSPLGTQSNILVHCRKKAEAEHRLRSFHASSSSSSSSPSPSPLLNNNKTTSTSSPSFLHGINVVVLHISSLSAAHFDRMFPLTTNYLQSKTLEQAGAEVFQMSGYTSLGVDPLQNQLPLFLGARLQINQPPKEGGNAGNGSAFEPYTILQDVDEDDVTREEAEEEEEEARIARRRKQGVEEEGEVGERRKPVITHRWGSREWLFEYFMARGYVTMFAEEECIVNSSIRKFFIRPPPSSSQSSGRSNREEQEGEAGNGSNNNNNNRKSSSSTSSGGVYAMIDHKFTEIFCLLEPRSNIDPEGDSDYWRRENHEFEKLSVIPNNAGINNNNHLNSTSIRQPRQQQNFWRHGASCVGNRRVHTLSMDYLLQFMDNYEGAGRFASILFSGAKERTMTRVKTMDADLLALLQAFERRSLFKSTAVVLISDVGVPLDAPYRTLSKAGQLESKLPLFQMILPRDLFRRHPEIEDNLRQNQNKLVTALDAHLTLKHLAAITTHFRDSSSSHSTSSTGSPPPPSSSSPSESTDRVELTGTETISSPTSQQQQLQQLQQHQPSMSQSLNRDWLNNRRDGSVDRAAISLFDRIPLSRRCSSARISKETCTCEDMSLVFGGFLLLPCSILFWWCYTWFRSARRVATGRRTIFVNDLGSI